MSFSRCTKPAIYTLLSCSLLLCQQQVLFCHSSFKPSSKPSKQLSSSPAVHPSIISTIHQYSSFEQAIEPFIHRAIQQFCQTCKLKSSFPTLGHWRSSFMTQSIHLTCHIFIQLSSHLVINQSNQSSNCQTC